jgi:hypothetical protein
MPISPPPSLLEELGNRPFSFYPPIVGVEHNEWHFRKATWSEILVFNSQSSAEVWIPRRYIGEISRVDEPVVIVGLTKELEYKGGAVWPYQRRVIEMPVAVGDTRRLPVSEPPQPAPVVGISLGGGPESRIGRMIAAALMIGIVACVIIVTAYRQGEVRSRVVFTSKDQDYLALAAGDDYWAVVHKLGIPETDRWRSETGEIQYRALGYPKRAYTVVLMGSDRKQASYIGTVDANWRPVHFISLRSGGDTRSMLEGLRKF